MSNPVPVSYYAVEVYYNSNWITFQNVGETGQPVYTVQTPYLQDETSYLFGVDAVGFVGQNSTLQQYQIKVCTCPLWGDGSVDIGYNPTTNQITINLAP